jgi:hypothetical protein
VTGVPLGTASVMLITDLNVMIMCFLILGAGAAVSTGTALHLLLTVELLWITLYGLVVQIGMLYDTASLVALTFFFLVLSAVELGIGLILVMVQHTLLRSVSLLAGRFNFLKFTTRLNLKVPGQSSSRL